MNTNANSGIKQVNRNLLKNGINHNAVREHNGNNKLTAEDDYYANDGLSASKIYLFFKSSYIQFEQGKSVVVVKNDLVKATLCFSNFNTIVIKYSVNKLVKLELFLLSLSNVDRNDPIWNTIKNANLSVLPSENMLLKLHNSANTTYIVLKSDEESRQFQYVFNAIIHKVTSAELYSENKLHSAISNGIVILLGINENDTIKEGEYIVNKILKCKLWHEIDELNEKKRWACSVQDKNFEVLLVSQFTLYGKLKPNNSLTFHKAMKQPGSKLLYDQIVNMLCREYSETKIKTGNFGHYMDIRLNLDGPVVLTLEKENSDV